MGLLQDLQLQLENKTSERTAQINRRNQWQDELNRLIQRQNNSITPRKWDSVIQEAQNNVSDAKAQISRLTGEITDIESQIKLITEATAVNISQGQTESEAINNAELRFNKIKQDQENYDRNKKVKKVLLIVGIIVVVIVVAVLVIRRIRKKKS